VRLPDHKTPRIGTRDLQRSAIVCISVYTESYLRELGYDPRLRRTPASSIVVSSIIEVLMGYELRLHKNFTQFRRWISVSTKNRRVRVVGNRNQNVRQSRALGFAAFTDISPRDAFAK
jgi:hypothetical protein